MDPAVLQLIPLNLNQRKKVPKIFSLITRVAGAARSCPFWLEPEPFFWSDSSSYSTVNILFLGDPKYDYDYKYDYDDYDYDD